MTRLSRETEITSPDIRDLSVDPCHHCFMAVACNLVQETWIGIDDVSGGTVCRTQSGQVCTGQTHQCIIVQVGRATVRRGTLSRR